ncbi:MAG: chemotaxis protein CheB, partial [Candidatus Firestonebacteria bacterium]
MNRHTGQNKTGRVKAPPFCVVGIGGSAGGLEAFLELLKNLPAAPGMAFVFIMHLAAGSRSMLTELLARETSMPVQVIKNGMEIKLNNVYVIPPAKNITVSGGKLFLTKQKNELHMPIDIFFSSLAKEYGCRSIGVVLSGTAKDGSLGIEAVKEEGGLTFAQNEISSKFPEMPQNAAKSGKVQFILSPKGIAEKLVQIGKEPESYFIPYAKMPKSGFSESKSLEAVFDLLFEYKKLNFAMYKKPTISRRLLRRMALLKITKIRDYFIILRTDKKEADNLFDDLLINVSGFFRDAEVFKELQKKYLWEIIKNKKKDQPLRLWVPACSSGEEVYSLAMCIFEILAEKHLVVPIQIFGTDVSEKSIGIARAGLYDHSIEKDVSSVRLRRFFYKEGNKYKVSKQLRDVCVFSTQNVFADPPFSNIDLVSCRNLLIYLIPSVQKKVFLNIHYALRPGGIFVLGKSENVGVFSAAFKAQDRKRCIFIKRNISAQTKIKFDPEYTLTQRLHLLKHPALGQNAGQLTKNESMEEKVNRIMAKGYYLSGVYLNSSMEIVYYRGATGRYLESSEGAPSLNILKIARDGLFLPLRSALSKAKKTKRNVRVWADRVKVNERFIRVYLTVIPILTEVLKETEYMVIFDEIEPGNFSVKSYKKSDKYSESLEKEILETKEYLQTVISEQEIFKEQMKVAGEEILSSNEELQSTNEELETSKEELQSSNEELITSNEEMQHRSAEAALYSNDLENLLNSINMPVVMIGIDFRIRRTTPQCESALGLLESDKDRALTRLKLKVEIPELEAKLASVLKTLMPLLLEIQNTEKKWYSVLIKPYRTMEHKIDGVVLIFTDITEAKNAHAVIQEAREYAENIVATVQEPLLVLDGGMKVLSANNIFFEIFKVRPEETIGRLIYELGNGQWNIPKLKALIADLSLNGVNFREHEIKHKFESIGLKVMLVSGQHLPASNRILISIVDISERKMLEEQLLQAKKLEAIGALTGGIAHDFNNALGIIMGYSDISLKLAAKEPKILSGIEEIKKAAIRAAALTRQLLAFSRKQ